MFFVRADFLSTVKKTSWRYQLEKGGTNLSIWSMLLDQLATEHKQLGVNAGSALPRLGFEQPLSYTILWHLKPTAFWRMKINMYWQRKYMGCHGVKYINTNSLFRGIICCLMATLLHHGNFVASYELPCVMATLLRHGKSLASWKLCCVMAILLVMASYLRHGNCVESWQLCCVMAS